MSYNVDSVRILGGEAWMEVEDVKQLCEELEFRPDVNVLDTLLEQRKDGEQRLSITRLWWCGEGSGSTYGLFLAKVVPLIHGRIETLWVWEGGDSISGLIIDNGIYTDCNVEYTLVPKVMR